MRGTRYGDFSRSTFQPHRYDGLLAQQGRVQLDADANEQAAIAAARLEQAIADLMGGSAAPATDPGFAVRPLLVLAFDGAGAAEVLDVELLLAELGPAFTVELWVAWDGGAGTLLDAGAWRLSVDADGDLTFALVGPEATVAVTAAGALAPGSARHVAAVAGDGFAALFVDARQAAREAVAAAPEATTGERLLLGAAIAGDEHQDGFRGLLRDVRLWGAARSPAQIALARRGTAATDDEALRAWWPLTQTVAARGSGVAAEHRGDRHATLIGARPPRWRLVDLELGAGRYYVDGVAVEQRTPALLGDQAGAGGDALPSEPGRHLLYLEVWEDTVTAAQDPDLREVALGGLDTAVRTRRVHAVRHVPFDADARAGDGGRLADHAGRRATTGAMSAHHDGALVPGNFLYRVEVHRGGVARGRDDDAARHDDRPTLKWSRRNGGEVWAIAPVTPGTHEVTLLDGGPVPLALRPGDVVELLDDGVTLDGPAPPLYVVGTADVQQGRLTVVQRLAAGVADAAERRPHLRLWQPVDAREDGAEPEIPLHAGPAVALEDGIAVRFAPGRYRRGDYWWVVAREDLGGIAWPQADDGRAALRPPDGVERRQAPLALLEVDDAGLAGVRDLRRIAGAVVSRAASDDGEQEDAWTADDGGEDGEPGPDGEPDVVVLAEADEPDGAATGDLDDPGDPDPAPDAAWSAVVEVDLPPEPLVAVAAFGDDLIAATTTALWRIDVAAGTAAFVAGLPQHRERFTLCSVGAIVLVVGGRPLGGKRPDGCVLVCDLARGTARREAGTMPEPVDRPAAALLGGALHVLGGSTGRRPDHDPTDGYQLYDVTTGGWRRGPAVPTACSGATALASDDRLHLIGGRHRSLLQTRELTSHHVLEADAWAERAPVPEGHAVRGAASGRDGPVVLHERHEERGAGLLAYDGAADGWRSLPDPPEAVEHAHLAVCAGRHVLLGRRTADGAAVLQVLDGA